MGRTIGLEFAQRKGVRPTWFDCSEPYRATLSSGGLILPTNRTRGLKMTPDEFVEALRLLRRHYGLRRVEFPRVGLRAWHVLTADVLDHPGVAPIVRSPVMRVWDGGLETADGKVYEGHVLVAAGYRSLELLQGHPGCRGQIRAGTSFRYHGRMEPSMLPESKKKIVLAFNETRDVIWAEDQTQTLLDKYTLENIVHTDLKLRRLVGVDASVVDYRTGHLLVRYDGPWFSRISRRLTVATATERAGTILAAHWASLFVKRYKS